MERREFLQGALSGLAATSASSATAATVSNKIISIQVPLISFYDEGVEAVLDNLQRRAYVNTIFVASYGRLGISGRQVPGQPLTDHGKPGDGFHGGNFTTIHPQYYKDIGINLEDTRAPDLGGADIMPQIAAAAKKRGIEVMMWAEDVFNESENFPNLAKISEVDVHGKPTIRGCYNNPHFRNFLLGLTEDLMRSYDTDGMMWCMEATGALSNALSFSHMGCFCQFCAAKAKKQGIDMERARKGFLELEKFLAAAKAGTRPVDGYYITFWRLLLRNPEMLAWENFWHDGLKNMYRDLYAKIKSINPNLQAGWHIEHALTYNFLYRAEREIKEFAGFTDFLKIVMYNNAAGERVAAYLRRIHQGAFGDFSLDDLANFEYRIMNFRERSIDEIPYSGFSPDYVARETKRAMDGAAGTGIKILPGTDIDVPTALDHSRSNPPGTRAAVAAALAQNPDGIVLSRKYSEMRLTNLSGAGEAIRAAGWA